MNKFTLVYQLPDATHKKMGYLSFNGKFVFELDESIPTELWQKVGIIPVDPVTRKRESVDLFAYINARLPIDLRNASKDSKLDYIKRSGLRVPSDNFLFIPF